MVFLGSIALTIIGSNRICAWNTGRISILVLLWLSKRSVLLASSSVRPSLRPWRQQCTVQLDVRLPSDTTAESCMCRGRRRSQGDTSTSPATPVPVTLPKTILPIDRDRIFPHTSMQTIGQCFGFGTSVHVRVEASCIFLVRCTMVTSMSQSRRKLKLVCGSLCSFIELCTASV